MAVADHFDTVQKIYIAFYQRPADPAGLRYWADRVEVAGGDTAAVIDAFANSEEATALYGDITEENIGETVTAIYQALFGRAPDAAGLAFYEEAFANGELSAGSIALQILDGARGDDIIAINNKVAVADEFTQQVAGQEFDDANFGQGGSFPVTYDAEDVEAARGILADVTADPATVLTPAGVAQALQEQIANDGEVVGGAGSTFTLTAGPDFADVVGSSRLGGNLESDFRFTSDNERVIAGANTLNGDALLDGSTTDNDVLQATGVANFNGSATVANIENVNVALSAEAGALSLAGFTGVKNLTLTGTTSATGIAPLTVTAIAASGVSNIDVSAVTSSVNNGTVGITVSDNTANQAISFTGGSLSDVVWLGNGNNTITTAAGDDTVQLGNGNNNVDTGAGNDSVTVGNGNNTINVGDGVNTVRVVGDGVTTTTDGNNTITGGSGTDTVSIENDGNNTINTGAAGDTVVILGNGDNTIDVAAGDNSVAVAGNGDNVITSGEGVDTITITGTGSNTVTTGAGADVIVIAATSGENIITAGAGADSITVSGADDLLVFNAGDTGLTAATADTVYGFSTGNTTLSFGDVAGSVTNYAASVASATSFAEALTAANAGLDGTVQYFLQDVNDGASFAGSYLFVDSDLNGEADVTVALVGITTADFDATDIVANA